MAETQGEQRKTQSDNASNAPSSLQEKLAWSAQKPIKDLTLKDVLMWENVWVSLLLFMCGQAFYLLLTKYNFSLLTLVGRVVLIQVIVFFLWNVGSRVINNKTQPEELPFGDFKVSLEVLQPYIESVATRINTCLSNYISILSCKNLLATAKFAVVVQIVCWIGNLMSFLTITYLAFTVAFSVPRLYVWKQKEIDAIIEKAKEQITKVYDNVMAKIQKPKTQ